jgi:hypothetical protein
MLRNICLQPDFDGLRRDPARARRTVSLPLPKAMALRAIWGVLRDGVAASRRYERLRSLGIPHDPALREAIGVAVPVDDVRPARMRATPRAGDTPALSDSSDNPTSRPPVSARIGNLAFVC